MKRALLGLVTLGCILLQIGFLPALRPFGIVPDILLPLVVLTGLYGQASTAVVVAIVGGLCADMASSVDFGLWTAILLLAALACGYVQRAGVELQPLVGAAMVTVGTVIMSAILLAGVVGTTLWPWASLLGGLALQVVINVVLIILLRPVVEPLVASPASVTMVG